MEVLILTFIFKLFFTPIEYHSKPAKIDPVETIGAHHEMKVEAWKWEIEPQFHPASTEVSEIEFE